MSDLAAGPGERHYIIGGTRAGKSSFLEWEMRHVQNERPSCMQILVDTKPRFRAETERQSWNAKGRKSAAWRYRDWVKGPVLPGSVLVDLYSDRPFKGLWTHPGEIAILQSGEYDDWRRMLFLLEKFVKAQIRETERKITVDEVMDFYGRNTFGIDQRRDVFYRAARAGGERKIGMSLGAQYVKGFPPLVRRMASRITLFHLTDDRDMSELRSSGITDKISPAGNYVFKQWEVLPGGTVSEPVTARLEYPQWFLDQLSDT